MVYAREVKCVHDATVNTWTSGGNSKWTYFRWDKFFVENIHRNYKHWDNFIQNLCSLLRTPHHNLQIINTILNSFKLDQFVFPIYPAISGVFIYNLKCKGKRKIINLTLRNSSPSETIITTHIELVAR